MLRTLGRVIAAAPATTTLPDPLDWTAAVAVAGRSLLLPALRPALARQGFAPPVEPGEMLEAMTFLNQERNTALLAQLEEVATILNGIGIEPVAIKGGGHLALGLWPSPAERVVGDLDLLVPAERLPDAMGVLMRRVRGIMADPVDPRAVAAHKHAPPLSAPGWVGAVELHFEVMVGGYRDLLPAAPVLTASLPHALRSAMLRTPSPTHQALIAMLHGMIGHEAYFRPFLPVRDLLDLHFLHRRHGAAIDWSWIEAHLRERGWGSLSPIIRHCVQEMTGTVLPIGQAPKLAERVDLARWRVQSRIEPLRRLGTVAGYASRWRRGWRADDGARPLLRHKAGEIGAYPGYLQRLVARVWR